jgi:hypothetical protein
MGWLQVGAHYRGVQGRVSGDNLKRVARAILWLEESKDE